MTQGSTTDGAGVGDNRLKAARKREEEEEEEGEEEERDFTWCGETGRRAKNCQQLSSP